MSRSVGSNPTVSAMKKARESVLSSTKLLLRMILTVSTSRFRKLTLICGIVATVAAFLSLVCWGACTATICANADYFTSLPESIKDAFHP